MLARIALGCRPLAPCASCVLSTRSSSSRDGGESKQHLPVPKVTLTRAEIWARREKLAQPTIQRLEQPLPPKVYYAPDWDIDQSADGELYNPLTEKKTTPEKWEYYNKIVWPPNYVVPETGLPKAKEVFHCRESIHYSRKKMWYACQMVWRMNLVEAIKQLKFRENKGTAILCEVLEEAKERAKNEFHIGDTDNMFVAEAFSRQEKIIRGKKRHAHDRWTVMRHRYIHVYVRIEEGEGPGYQGRSHEPDGWEKTHKYYEYLRAREPKYSL